MAELMSLYLSRDLLRAMEGSFFFESVHQL